MTKHEVDNAGGNKQSTVPVDYVWARLRSANEELLKVFSSKAEAFRREMAKLAPKARTKGKRRRGQWWVR